MMFSKDLKRLSFDNIIPFNEDDLLIIANPYLSFRLTNIVDENNNFFSIKSIMLDNDVFACKDFNVRCKEFARIMEARIERYFMTNKVSYLFFDDEEQNFLKGLIRRNTLSATVAIYMRDDVRKSYEEIDYTDLSHKEHMEVSKYLRRLRAMMIVRPERYYTMYVSSKKDAKERFEKFKKGKDKNFMQSMRDKYKKLSDIKTKKQFASYYRGLSKKYHPDMPGGSHELFAQINVDFESLKETYWFKSLEGESEENTNSKNHDEKRNILIQASEE